LESFSFPDTGHSGKPHFLELEVYEAAVADLTLPASSCPSLLHFICNKKTGVACPKQYVCI